MVLCQLVVRSTRANAGRSVDAGTTKHSPRPARQSAQLEFRGTSAAGIGKQRHRTITAIMMIHLIEYNRPEGRLVTFKVFAESERSKAQDLRLEIELDLNRRKVDHEVVLLQAESEAALRRTHGRYFYDGR